MDCIPTLNKTYRQILLELFRAFLSPPNKLLILVICLTAIEINAQEDGVELRINEIEVHQDSCLTNKSNFGSFKLVRTTEQDLNTVRIHTAVNQASKEFQTIEAFNDFDFKFWLLSNSAFKSEQFLRIEIIYGRNSETFTEKDYIICLSYIDANDSGDRGGGEPDFIKFPVYFATDRNAINTSNLNERFGNERSELKYGITQVSIPRDHKIGEIESPAYWKLEFRERPSKHIMMHDIKMLDRDAFFSSLKSNIGRTARKRTFLFVHGYNTSFSEAAKRTAQISYDLLFDGKPVFYSWPSQASTLKYPKDEANIQWSQANITHFLEDYLTRSGAEEIYLVAHSMGNRGLTRAVIELMEKRPELASKIKEIILAAPDIDADVFKRDIAPEMVSLVQKPITLYVSSDDLALKASKELHGNPRAGDSGKGMVIVKGVETIDASGIDTSFLSHSYFADTSSIISDIYDLIKSGKRALDRKTLKPMELGERVYYKVKN